MAGRPLTAKQQAFVDEYLVDMNGKAAAIRAGYSPRTAETQSCQLLKKTQVKRAVQKALAKRSRRTEVDADYVLRQAQKLHERCMQEIEPYTDRKGNQIHDEDGNPLYVFNANGAAKALEIIGKHINVAAFSEKHEISTPEGQPLIKIEFVKPK